MKLATFYVLLLFSCISLVYWNGNSTSVRSSLTAETGFQLTDDKILQIQNGVSSRAGVAVYHSYMIFVGSALWCLVIEWSRVRANIPQVFVAIFPTGALLFGAGMLVPGGLALSNILKDIKAIPGKQAVHEISVFRAGTILVCNLAFIILAFLVIPLFSESWPGGTLEPITVVALIFTPGLPVLLFACDSRARGKLGHMVEYISPAASNGTMPDRDFAHYLVMLNCAISGLVGLFVHMSVLAKILLYDSFAGFYLDISSNSDTVIMFVNLFTVVVSCYFWLQEEAMEPLQTHNKSRGTESWRYLFSWRDLIAILLFGPACHFSTAFASREYGLLQLDELRLSKV